MVLKAVLRLELWAGSRVVMAKNRTLIWTDGVVSIPASLLSSFSVASRCYVVFSVHVCLIANDLKFRLTLFPL